MIVSSTFISIQWTDIGFDMFLAIWSCLLTTSFFNILSLSNRGGALTEPVYKMIAAKKTPILLAIFLILFPALLYLALWSDKQMRIITGPSRMIAGPNNALYILVDDCIEIVTPEGKKLSSLNLKRDMGMKESMADFFVESNGDLILGLSDSGRIISYSPEGKFLKSFPIQVAAPPKGEPYYFKFTKDPTGYFYLSDSYANSVRIFDAEGREVKAIKGPVRNGNEPGEEVVINKDFNWPNRLLFVESHLYVIDTNNQRIIRFDRDGSFSKAIASWGKHDESVFTRPTDLSNNSGNVYVINRKPSGDKGSDIFSIDSETGVRLKFDLHSPKLSAYFEKNTTIEPEDIMARANDVLVSDQTAMKIFRFSKKGEFLGTFGQEVTAGHELKRAFYRWTKIISIICMILLLASLLLINRRNKKKELLNIVKAPTDKPLHFLQRKISLPDGRYILLCLLVIINALLWINVSRFGASSPRTIIPLLFGLVLPIAVIVLLFVSSATILRAVPKPADKEYPKRMPALMIGLVILLSVAIMLGRIINALPDGIARPLYHVMLSLSMGDYQIYSKIDKIGNVSSVPYLIKALKSEQNNESLRGDMSHHPLLDALSRITGNNPGYKYEDWENWWMANKDKTEQQWRLSAIEKEGYPAADYPGATAIASIIEAMGFKERVPYGKEYLLTSAGVLLIGCSSSEVLSVIENRLKGNTSARFKRGASRALGLLGLKEGIPFLRILVISDDLSVRSIALSELNKLHARLLSFAPAINLAHIVDTGENIKYMSAGTDKNDNDNLFYATSSTVKKLDLKTGEILWSHNTLGTPGSDLVISRGRVLFYCFDGMVYCLDSSTGHFLWKHQTASPRQGYHCKITVLGDLAIMGAEDNLWAFDIASGRVKWIIRNQPSSEKLIEHSSDHIFLATGRGEFLKISSVGKVIDTIKTGTFIQTLTADNDYVYVITQTQGKPMHLKIYSAGKLTLLHDDKVGWNDLPSLTLNADTIIVSGQAGIRAFDRKSAQLLWSEEIKRHHSHPKIEPSDKYLAYGDEIRTPRTGEIIYKYRVTGNSQSRVIGNNFVINTADKKIYIFRLPLESGI